MSRVNIPEIQPAAYEAMFGLEAYLAKSTIDAKLREIVRIRASVINGCQYCIGLHSDTAAKLGESTERIKAISNWQNSDVFDEKERAVLAATDEITHISDAGLTDETYAKVSLYFNEEEIAQLIVLCAAINAWNRLGVSMAG